MNEVAINGVLINEGKEYNPGHVYTLDVTRRSGVTDILLVLSPDGGLLEGEVHITGHVRAEYIRGLGVPLFIVPDSVEAGTADGASRTTVTGMLKADPVCRATKTARSIASICIRTEEGMVPAVLWGKAARDAETKYKAGDMVKVTGRLQSREYPDRKGEWHTTYELSAAGIEPA